jgi:peptide/nickel transport system permease protein
VLTLLVRRIVRLVVVLAGVSLVTFAILHVSGDPVSLMMPEAPEIDRVALRQAMGFNEPLPVQFARFLANTARGNFGNSFFHRAPALPLVPKSIMVEDAHWNCALSRLSQSFPT